jgi:tetratricopeptide (TPR) repeat protein
MDLWLALPILFLLLDCCREMWSFVWLPRRAHQLFRRGERLQAVRLMERCLSRRSWGPGELKSPLRYQLAWFHMTEGRYDEAAQQLRTALKQRLKPALEASFRERLAECLDGRGDHEAAATERQQVAKLLSRMRKGWEWHSARGQLLENEKKFAEACEAYEQSLKTAPAWPADVRSALRVRLGLASYNAGRPAAAIRWAEEEIRENRTSQYLMVAHSVAGLGNGVLGNLEEAERRRQAACEVAMAIGGNELAGQYLAHLAGVQLKRGKLVEAIATCERASAMSLSARRSARVTEAECLRAWGRFDQARVALEQALRTQAYAQPARERQHQAVVALGQAQVEIEAGRPENALPYLEAGAAELEPDRRLGLWHALVTAEALALLRRREESLALLSACEARLEELAGDPDAKRSYRSAAGAVYSALGDFSRSRDEWEGYLALRPDPLDQPRGFYHLGECHLRLGDGEAAKAAFHQALEAKVDTHWARKARKRLEEMA